MDSGEIRQHGPVQQGPMKSHIYEANNRLIMLPLPRSAVYNGLI